MGVAGDHRMMGLFAAVVFLDPVELGAYLLQFIRNRGERAAFQERTDLPDHRGHVPGTAPNQWAGSFWMSSRTHSAKKPAE